MKKTFVALSGLLILLTVILTQELIPLHFQKEAIPKSQVILQEIPAAEDLPPLDLQDKKTAATLPITLQLVFLSFYSIIYLPANAFSNLFAFLITVFFQSNYVDHFPSS